MDYNFENPFAGAAQGTTTSLGNAFANIANSAMSHGAYIGDLLRGLRGPAHISAPQGIPGVDGTIYPNPGTEEQNGLHQTIDRTNVGFVRG